MCINSRLGIPKIFETFTHRNIFPKLTGTEFQIAGEIKIRNRFSISKTKGLC